MALDSSPCASSIVRKSLPSHMHQVLIYVFNKGKRDYLTGLPEVWMWDNLWCLSIDDPSFVDCERSPRLQQSIKAIQDRSTTDTAQHLFSYGYQSFRIQTFSYIIIIIIGIFYILKFIQCFKGLYLSDVCVSVRRKIVLFTFQNVSQPTASHSELRFEQLEFSGNN